MKEISVVIPAYNEQRRIRKTLLAVKAYLEGHFRRYEIIIVNDGSTDATQSVLSPHLSSNIRCIHYRPNRGKGYAVKTGMLAAKYNYILFCDADLATPIEELEKFRKEIPNYDFLIASRNMVGSRRVKDQTFLRQLAGRVFNFFVNTLVIKGISDSQCGFKLFRRKAVVPLFSRQTFDGFSFDVELICIANHHNLSFKEVPVDWYDVENSKVSAFSDSWRMFLDLLKIKLNMWKGVYD